MIKIEHVVLPSPEQMEFVIEGMRNPMNSWDKSDSFTGCYLRGDDCPLRCGYDIDCSDCNESGGLIIGPNDLSLMQKLSAAGTDHRKFMRMMPVMLRITAPLYWWKEFDTYKVGTVANSCSTMHKITEKEFTLEDFSTEHMIGKETPYDIDLIFGCMNYIIETLNEYRDLYLNFDKYKNDDLAKISYKFLETCEKKDIWWQLIQLLPSSYNQTRNVMLNYEVLKNMYKARKGHRLDEWVKLAKWIETLPYSELITN